MTQATLQPPRSVLQDWVMRLPLMQQTVLIGAVRGPDGFIKDHPVKPMLRWYRRCILISAMDGVVFQDPWSPGGGTFAGPSVDHVEKGWGAPMLLRVDAFMRTIDEFHVHSWLHLAQAFEIVGYQHPNGEICVWWNKVYVRMVHAMHLYPESKGQLDSRLGDTFDGWLERADPSIDRKGPFKQEGLG